MIYTSLPIPALTPIVTMESLCAQGKFVSASLKLPNDHLDCDWKFTLNGVEHEDIAEVYAPGDDTGWAVVYAKCKDSVRKYYVHGNWSIQRIER